MIFWQVVAQLAVACFVGSAAVLIAGRLLGALLVRLQRRLLTRVRRLNAEKVPPLEADIAALTPVGEEIDAALDVNGARLRALGERVDALLAIPREEADAHEVAAVRNEFEAIRGEEARITELRSGVEQRLGALIAARDDLAREAAAIDRLWRIYRRLIAFALLFTSPRDRAAGATALRGS